MVQSSNPLSGYFRAPKLYTKIPSGGKFYNADILDMPASNELPIYPMSAKDELIMKNPDALLNGEAVAQLISSCVPAVKKARKLISNDVDALLVAIQGASYGDDIEVKGNCPVCKVECSGTASVEAALETMGLLEKSYTFETHNGLTVELKPFSYESTVKAGIANFKSTRSLQGLADIKDEMEQLKAFNDSFLRIAALNFDLIVDSVANIEGLDPTGLQFVVDDPKLIREFLENCETIIGKTIEEKITDINKIGINKRVQLECEEHGVFEQEVGFDPVNFFTAS